MTLRSLYPPTFLIILSVVPWLRHSFAAPRNFTVDDTNSDTSGHNFAVKYFAGSDKHSWEDASCTGCWIQPDKKRVHDGTWHSATYNAVDGKQMWFDFTFEGSAVYIFFVLANTVDRNPTTETMANFSLDGIVDGSFHHIPNTTPDYQYDVLAYSKTGLKQKQRTLRVGVTEDGVPGDFWNAFDYAIVTVDEPDTITSTSTSASNTASSTFLSPTATDSPKTTTNVGAIAGGVIGGVAFLVLLSGLLLLYLQRRKKPKPGNRPDLLQGEGPMTERTEQSEFGASQTSGGTRDYDSPSRVPVSSYNQSPGLPFKRYPQSSPSNSTSALTGTSSSSRNALRDVRQVELERQVAQLQAQLQNLQNAPVQPASSTKMDDEEKRALRNQVTEMQQRMQQLEAAQRSTWAQGHTDDPPPPGYAPPGGAE